MNEKRVFNDDMRNKNFERHIVISHKRITLSHNTAIKQFGLKSYHSAKKEALNAIKNNFEETVANDKYLKE